MVAFVITVSDVVTFLAIAIVLGMVAWVNGRRAYRQWRCKHTRTFENGSCDEICRDCHKNLGFIGRKK